MAQIELRNIEKSFGKEKVLKNINLSISEGEFVVLLGPSGCGKTTLLNIISGLEIQDAGNILFNGKDVNHTAPKDRDVGFVFQNYSLYPHKTVYQNLAFALKFKDISAIEFKEMLNNGHAGKTKTELIDVLVRQVANTLGITDILDKRPGQLSGGQSQRVAIGRALIRQPQIFLFDEPLSNLDAILRVSLREEIKELHAKLKNTAVYVTHDQAEAMSLADKIVVLKDGQIQQIGTPEEVYSKPQSIFVAKFVGSPPMNLLEVEIIRNGNAAQLLLNKTMLEVEGEKLHKKIDSLSERKVIIGFRPENVKLTRTSDCALELNLMESYREFTGNSVIIKTTLDNSQISILAGVNESQHSEKQLTGFISSVDLLFFDYKTLNNITHEYPNVT